jgi:uncharacterized protein YacL
MTSGAVVALVVSAIVLMLVAGLSFGFDPLAVAIFGLVVALGALAVAVARKKDEIAPTFCRECHRVMSPNAPYCKHCGARTGG